MLCVDEKSQVQALERSQPVLPMMPGVPERRSHDHVRAGTTTSTHKTPDIKKWRWPVPGSTQSGPGSPTGTSTPRSFVRTKTADEILDKVAAYCGRISDSDHWPTAECRNSWTIALKASGRSMLG
ncbi:hypothetical protein GCM10010524_26560 [Streptomyces mexicanus]